MTNLIGPLDLGSSIAIIVGAVVLVLIVVGSITPSKATELQDLETKIRSNGSEVMTQKHSIMTSINSSQVDLVKIPKPVSDSASTSLVNESFEPKRIVPPERLQAFDPAAGYQLRKNSISSMNSTTGLSPSHLPYPPSIRSGTPDSTVSKKWIDPYDIHFNRPLTPTTKAWVSPLDVHFSRPTTPLASRPTTPTSTLAARRLSFGSNILSSGEGNNGAVIPIEATTTLTEIPNIKSTTDTETSGQVQADGINGLESDMFPLPPTATSRNFKFQTPELEQSRSPSRDGINSGNHSHISVEDTPASATTQDSFGQSVHTAIENSTLADKQRISSVSMQNQPVDPSLDLSLLQSEERARSIAASSRYSSNDYSFDSTGLPGKHRSRSRSRSLDSQSQQSTHAHQPSSSTKVIVSVPDHLGALKPDPEQVSEGIDQFHYGHNRYASDTIDGHHLEMNDDIESYSTALSPAQEDTGIISTSSLHRRSGSLPHSQLAIPNNVEIGTAVPFGVGLHKRGTSEGSENSIGDFYDAYYRLSTMGHSREQDMGVTDYQRSGRYDRESTVEMGQPWSLDPEKSQFGRYPPIQDEQPPYNTRAGEDWRPKPQKLYFQSPNQHRPSNADSTSIPQQLQPPHLQQQESSLPYERDLPLPHRPYRQGSPAPPSFSHRNQQRYTPPSQLDIGQTIVEMQSPLASPTFGNQGQSRFMTYEKEIEYGWQAMRMCNITVNLVLIILSSDDALQVYKVS
ncbi:hypothetical protein B7463_g3949, partial [Scytalidium lignicola]